LCKSVFTPDSDCKDAFVPQDDYLKHCLADAASTQSLDFTDSIKNSYMTQLDTITKPIGQDPKQANNRKAFDCRKKLGLGQNECLNGCTGPANGACLASGCKCTDAWTGDDCSTAKATGAAAPTTQPGANCPDDADISDYDASFHPVSYDGCCVITGDPGIFDNSDAVLVTKSSVCVCDDRAPGLYCVNVPGSPGAYVNCTGIPAGDNIFNTNCSAGYSIGKGTCYPKDNTNPTGPAKCSSSTAPSPVAAQFEKLPCDSATIQPVVAKAPANEFRFFCVGVNGDHLLKCPGNTITKCNKGCYGKFEMDGTTPCGKAACAAGAAAAGNY